MNNVSEKVNYVQALMNKQKRATIVALYVVGVTRLELATSCPPDKRATNCATPRKLCYVFIKFLLASISVYGSAQGASSLGIKPRGLWLQTVHRTLCLTRRPNCATPRNSFS